ncbi:MAG: putative Ig domain-containing protein [Clostridiales bacterium]|nr:putative Ig domain-containing protein [Clostridiales bacterium]
MRTEIKKKIIAPAAIAVSAILATSVIIGGGPGHTAFAAETLERTYFVSDYDSVADVTAEGRAVGQEIAEEGTVLLKNEDNALPLAPGSKISVFGKRLYRNTVFTGVLSGAGYQINSEVANFYTDNSLSGTGAPGSPGNGATVNGYPTGEADISKFTGSVEGYTDAAIVGIYRYGSEGFDVPRTMAQVNDDYKTFGTSVEPVEGARAVDDHYLQLDENETKLLAYCAEHFDKIIVIIRGYMPMMELGFLDDPDHYAYHEEIKAAILQDEQAVGALPGILTGEVNPSGHLPDTLARDFKADPTWNNFGNNNMEDYTDGSLVYAKGNQYANDNMRYSSLNGGGAFSNYVYYKEGIYTGYRYWETRGYVEGDEAWTGTTTDTLAHYAHGPDEAIHYYSKLSSDKSKQDNLDNKQWDNWYKAHVVYPFGHGLSYTDFEWELVNTEGGELSPNGKITVSVKVKNTGSVAGKDVVQLYYSAPYTDGGIEKAHVNLGAFAKTKKLAPGESQTLTLEFNVRDMASYDYNDKNGNGFKGYELEAGEYTVYIGENAHCWADDDVLNLTYTLSTGAKYETDPDTGEKIENRFDEISEQLLHEDRYPEDEGNNQKDMYMTRSDFAGTWPTMSYRLTAEQWIIEKVATYNLDTTCPLPKTWPADKPEDPWYNDEMPKQAVSRDAGGGYIQLYELFGKDYNDPLWDSFLNQLTVDELKSLVLQGRYHSGADIPDLGITAVYNEDHPVSIKFPNINNTYNFSMPNDSVTAATWNVELAYRRGKIFAELSLWGCGNPNNTVPGWYAPAINIHRSPFVGRLGEYFSEDSLLTGKLAAQIIIGSQEKGMFCYVKHFALNNQESNRDGVMTWANEQSMREVYFPAFEICVKEGKALGLMSAMNRLGPYWTGGYYNLLSGVLRNEWGFKGSIVTDAYSSTFGSADAMIRAGGSLVLGGTGVLNVGASSATTINLLRNSAHQVLYANANSMALNTGATPTAPQKMVFNAKNLKVGMVNMSYSDSLAGCIELNTQNYPDLDASKITFALAEQSRLPAGLKLESDGTIHGTPYVQGKLTFTVVATYDGGDTFTQSFTITVAPEGGIVIYEAENNVLKASIGSPFVADISDAYIYDPLATEEDIAGFPDITYKLGNGSRLPAGLTLLSNGMILGNPDKECRNYSFTVLASALGYGEAEFEFVISILYPITYYPKTQLPTAQYGKSYIAAVGTAECDVDVTYSLKDGDRLPNGLVLTAQGYIVGTPTEACSSTFTVIAKGTYTDPVEATYTLTVNPRFASTTELQYGKVGEAYFGSVATAEGSFDVTYKLVGGALPAGLKLDSDGTISGTPTASGTFTLIVRAEDGELADEITLNLFIAGESSVTTVVKGEKDTVKPAAIALGVSTGVFAIGFVVMTVMFVLSKKKRQ